MNQVWYEIAGVRIGIESEFEICDTESFAGYRIQAQTLQTNPILLQAGGQSDAQVSQAGEMADQVSQTEGMAAQVSQAGEMAAQVSQTEEMADQVSQTEGMAAQVSQTGCADAVVRFLPSTDVPVQTGEVLFRDFLHCITQEGDAVLHTFRIPLTPDVAAWNVLKGSEEIRIHYLQEKQSYFEQSFGCFNAMGIERILYAKRRFIFHCSYVDYEGRAVLFSAPSGGGKTTQGLLWEKHVDGAEMINGDRGVLEARNGQIICHGIPIAGSSGVFVNRSLPLAAIFVVRKAQENRVMRLKGLEAFRAVYSELTINMWDKAFVETAIDFAQELLESVPVYRLECTISEEAVRAAQEVIDGNG